MGLRLKFNLVLLTVFGVGLGLSAIVSRRILDENARDDVVRNADLMMGAAHAVRGYTNKQITPNLELQLMRTFLPQSLPAYAATEVFGVLREQHPQYAYKEAVLNPTNPRDLAVEWEHDIIQQFRNDPNLREFRGTRVTPAGASVYLARPIRISDPTCLRCHSTPDVAPATMVKLYGPNNGFGWKANETVGAQIVSVPMSVALDKAQALFRTFMLVQLGIFALAFVVLNAALSVVIVRPVVRIARAADAVSTGQFQTPEFDQTRTDEIGLLGTSINRLRRSLETAIHLLE